MDEIKLTLEEAETIYDDCTFCDCEACDVRDFCSAYNEIAFHPPILGG